jgi:DNA (cytosine-5)-methyltransferase 1
MARLQGFPDEFTVQGTWKSPIKQLGNAVPVQIGEVFGGKLKKIIESARTSVSVAA